MEAMGSSSPNKKVYDSIRKKWLEALPEEIVRQKLLYYLVEELGYPAPSIIIEKELSEIPFVCGKRVPERRIDVLCLEKGGGAPLLLIECKAVRLQEKMVAQVEGYNAFIRAPLICLASERELLLRWREDLPFSKLEKIPTYEQLTRDVLSSAPP